MRMFAIVMGFLLPSAVLAQAISVPIENVKPKNEDKPAEINAPTSQAPAASTSATSSPKVEKVQVTGSHIKRIDVEGASPVQTITRKEMDKTGYNSVGDVLRDTGVNSFGSTREASGSNAAGVAHVNLRGLGSSNTLVLLNGQRLPSDAVTGAVDLNLIPMAAVERVEILKDGASAIYGSDALGGVVNIITRKDFTGSEIALAQTTPEGAGGKKQEISLVNGFQRGRMNMVNVVQYRKNDLVYSRDRDWTTNKFSTTGSPGSYRDGGTGVWAADPNCPADRLVTTPAGSFCQFKYSDYSTELPDLQQLSILNETNVELNSRVKLTARAGATQKKIKWSFAPAPGTFTIPGSVADTMNIPGHTPGEDVDVRYRLSELGTRDTEVETNAYNMLLGTTVQLKGSWELEVAGSHNRVLNKDRGVNGYALTKQLEEAIASGQFNPFAPEGQRGNIGHTRYTPTEMTSSLLSSADVKATGEIFDMPAGAVSAAIGTTMTYQSYADVFDDRSVNNEVFGNAGSSGGGVRSTHAIFTELSVPVTEKLEAQIAGRFDHYSDFGDTTNPKAALLYRPNNQWLLRSSVGTGFKAPLMQDMYAASSVGFPSIIDAVACQKEREAGGATPSCLPQQYEVTSSGNAGLKEERSIAYNAGAVYQPNRDFSIGTDVFLVNTKNVVGIDYDDALEAEKNGTNLADYGVIVHRTNGYIDSIEAPLQNLSSQETAGLDFSTSYRLGKTKIGMDHSQLFYFKEEGFPGTGAKNKLGTRGKPHWRNTAAFSYLPSERHDLTLAALTTAGQQKTVVEQGRLRNYTQLDFQYSYKSKIGTFTAGVRNVMGTTPPIDDTDGTNPLDVTLYDQIGRQYYTGYKATF